MRREPDVWRWVLAYVSVCGFVALAVALLCGPG